MVRMRLDIVAACAQQRVLLTLCVLDALPCSPRALKEESQVLAPHVQRVLSFPGSAHDLRRLARRRVVHGSMRLRRRAPTFVNAPLYF